MASIRTLFGKKKKRLGFSEKVRTRDEINQEYNHHAIMYGHTSCLLEEAQKSLEDSQKILTHHLEAMVRLRLEGSKLPVVEESKEPNNEPKPA